MVSVELRITGVEKTTEPKRNRPVVRYYVEDSAGNNLGEFFTPGHSQLAQVLLQAARLEYWPRGQRLRVGFSDREVS